MKMVFVNGGNGKEDAQSQGGCGGNGKTPTIIYYDATYKTNADRIRRMSDEELAERWWEYVDCGECPVNRDCAMTGQDCRRLALNWLKQEATE